MKTDWRRVMDKDWIGCFVLPDTGKPDDADRSDKNTPKNNPYGELQVTLISVKRESVKVAGRMSKNNVARFAKNPYFDKPMLMNQATNLKELTKLTGSRFMEDWQNLNLTVTLKSGWGRHPAGGFEWGLRISKAKAKPILKEGTVEWTAVLAHVQKGNDPAGARVKYQISDELFKKLEDGKPKKS